MPSQIAFAPPTRPKCQGRLRVLSVLIDREPVGRILGHLGLPTEGPPVARARDPSDDEEEGESAAQLELAFA